MTKKGNNKNQTPSLLRKLQSLIHDNLAIHIMVICVLGCIVYSNTFHASFHLDDITGIESNTEIRDIGDFRTILKSKVTGAFNRRFFGTYTFALNYHFHGNDVFGYHVTNLIIHLCAALTAYWLMVLVLSTPALRRDGITHHKKLAAFLVGLLFVSHPAQTQAVTYIVQRLASLATLFYLLSLALYLTGRLEKKRRGTSIICYGGSVLAALLGMATKEIAFTIPLAVILTEFVFFRSTDGTLSGGFAKKAAVLIGILVILVIASMELSPGFFPNLLIPRKVQDAVAPDITIPVYLMTQFRVLPTYIRLLVLPLGQNFYYDFPLSLSLFEPKTLAGFLFLAGLFVFAIWLLPRCRLISFGIFWFFLTLSVESSFVPIRHVIFEHRMYLPFFGFAVAVVGALFALTRERYLWKAVGGLLILILGFYSPLTYARNAVWRDELTLWNDVIAKFPQKARGYFFRGREYILRGDDARARTDFEKTLELYPPYEDAHNNLGIIAYRTGDSDQAIRHFRDTLAINQYNGDARFNLAIVYHNSGDYGKVIDELRQILYLPRFKVPAHYYMGYASAQTGDFDGAVKHFTAALDLKPDYTEAHFFLGNVLLQTGETDRAISHFRAALKLEPGMWRAMGNLGGALYAAGRYDEALGQLNAAVRLKPDYADAHSNLGLVLAALGRLDEAVAHLRTVVRLDPGNAAAYRRIGDILDRQGKHDEARRFRLQADSLKAGTGGR